ncbi:MAG: flagellar biosynthetic protein FliR [Candidatus Gastranaerophilales bacterium]|nr:flagellar biosynthetic protein FliR [Candidatus Gastranaerophilales bacterium]
MIEAFFEIFKYFPELDAAIIAGLLIFTRFLGFTLFSPVIGRSEIPAMVKVSFALLLSVAFVGIVSPGKPPADTTLFLSLILNFVFGSLVGFIAQCIFAAISAGGDMINMQMGLSSSVMFDQSTRSQSSVMGKFFIFLGTVLFLNIGGMYWLFSAFERTFDIFPIYSTSFPLMKVVNMEYLVILTGNVLYVGLQIAAPILIATLGQDIILGVISKTAPQVNVFQLSFLFKPLLGVAIMIVILPMLVNVINDYFISFANIY